MQLNNFLNTADFSTIFIIFIVVKFSLETYLKIRNISSINKNKDAIPKRFVGVVTEEEYKKWLEKAKVEFAKEDIEKNIKIVKKVKEIK